MSKCIYEGCKKIASYGIKDTKKALYCSQHTPINYEDVIHKKCIYEGCKLNIIRFIK
jgi:hypothetical protein